MGNLNSNSDSPNKGIQIMFLGMNQQSRRQLISYLAGILDLPQIKAVPDPFALIDSAMPDDMATDVVRSMLLEAANPLIADAPLSGSPLSFSTRRFEMPGVEFEGDIADHFNGHPSRSNTEGPVMHVAEDPGILAAKLLHHAGDFISAGDIGMLNMTDDSSLDGDLLTGAPKFKKLKAAFNKVKDIANKVSNIPIVKNLALPLLKKTLTVAFPMAAGALAVAKKVKDKIDTVRNKVKDQAAALGLTVTPKAQQAPAAPVKVPTAQVAAVLPPPSSPADPSSVPQNADFIPVSRAAVARAVLDLMSQGDIGTGDVDEDQEYLTIPRTLSGDMLEGDDLFSFTGDLSDSDWEGDIFTGAPKLLGAARAKVVAAGKNALNWMKNNKAKVMSAGAGAGGTAALVAASNLMQTDPDSAMQLVANEVPQGSAYEDGADQSDTLLSTVESDDQTYDKHNLGVGSSIFVMRSGIGALRATSELHDIANQGNAIYSDWKDSFLSINPTFLVGDMDALSQSEKAILILLHGLPKTSVSVIPAYCLDEMIKELRSPSSNVLSPSLSSKIIMGLRKDMQTPGSVDLLTKDMSGEWAKPRISGDIPSDTYIPTDASHLLHSTVGDLLTGAPLLLKAAAPAMKAGGIVSTRAGQLIELGTGKVVNASGPLMREPLKLVKGNRVKTLLSKAAAATGLGAAAAAGAYGVQKGFGALEREVTSPDSSIYPISPLISDMLTPQEKEKLGSGRMLVIPFIGDVDSIYVTPGGGSMLGRTLVVGDISVEAGSLIQPDIYE